MTYRRKQVVFAYVLLFPAIIYFLVYFFGPIAVELWASFYTGQPLIGQSQFAGLENYARVFSDRLVQKSLGVTLIYSFGSTFITIGGALLFAAMLAGPTRLSNAVRALLFFPYIVSFVIGALMWRAILDPFTGILNSVLLIFGLPTQSWLANPDTAIWVLVLVSVWKDLGYATLIYIAAIQGIPKHLYDAARVDGATPIDQFRDITLPLLMPTTLFLAVTLGIISLQELALPYLMTGGGPANATRLFSLHVYETAFRDLNIGYASALSFLMFLFILLVTFLQFRLLNRDIRHV